MKSSFKLNGVTFNISSGLRVDIDETGALTIDSDGNQNHGLRSGFDLDSVPVYGNTQLNGEPFDFTVHGSSSDLIKNWKNVGDKFLAITNSKTGSGIRNAFYVQGMKVGLKRRTKSSARKNHEFVVTLLSKDYDNNYHAKLARRKKA